MQLKYGIRVLTKSKSDFDIQSYFIDFPIGAQPNTRTVAPNFVLPMACSRAAGTPVQSMTKSKDSSSISCKSFGEMILNPNPKIFLFDEISTISLIV